MLSVELGPGLLGKIFDGLQNPLPELAEVSGYFLQRGTYLPPLSEEQKWEFTPLVEPGAEVESGSYLGWVPEGLFEHKIMVPFDVKERWTVKSIVAKGTYTIKDDVAVIESPDGVERNVCMVQSWPVKIAIRAYNEQLRPTEPMTTKVRIIDTFFPVARGGTYCIPGPFGAGKTVLQQITSRYADVDIVIIAACGERAGEVVETIREFPKL